MILAQRERHALADLFLTVGPDAPTLCEGWETRDLLGHLLVREGRPDAAAGGLIKPLQPRLEATTKAMLSNGFRDAVERLRQGPPRWSPFGLPGLDEQLNTPEFFIHHEDVRRAQGDGWEPRELSAEDEAQLWSTVKRMARVALLRQPRGVVLVVPDGPRAKVRAGGVVDVVTGTAGELLMWVSGRRDHARVEVTCLSD